MAPRKRVSTRRKPQEDEDVPRPPVEAQQSDGGTDFDYESGAAEEGATSKKPKFTSPLKRPASESVENGSACSSPSASGFVVVPSQNARGKEEEKTKKKTSASKLFSDDEVISPRGEEEEKTKKMGKKTSASKLFSDDQVISLLKGLAVFWANGQNSKWAEFHLFIKNVLGNQFSKTQVSEKVRNLKSKFERISKRGGRIDISDPHESAVFELSKALWGDDKEIAGQTSENVDEEEANEILAERGHVVENDEGSKKKKKNKKLKQVNEDQENKKMRKQEHEIEDSVGEGDLRDAANTILSIRKLVDENGEGNEKLELVDGHGEGNEKSKVKNGEGNKKMEPVAENENGEGNKKSRKKKRKQGNTLDEKKELVNEGMHVDVHEEEENKISRLSSKQKQVNGDGDGERNKKMKKTKLVVECDEADKIAEKEVDEHAAKGEISKEVDQHNDEEEKLLKEGKLVDDDEQQAKKISKKPKQEGGHDVKKDSANQGKQVDDDFQGAYPLLYASFNTSEYPRAVMRNCVLIGRENAQELEKKWRELKAEELRLELKRLDLMISRGK